MTQGLGKISTKKFAETLITKYFTALQGHSGPPEVGSAMLRRGSTYHKRNSGIEAASPRLSPSKNQASKFGFSQNEIAAHTGTRTRKLSTMAAYAKPKQDSEEPETESKVDIEHKEAESESPREIDKLESPINAKTLSPTIGGASLFKRREINRPLLAPLKIELLADNEADSPMGGNDTTKSQEGFLKVLNTVGGESVISRKSTVEFEEPAQSLSTFEQGVENANSLGGKIASVSEGMGKKLNEAKAILDDLLQNQLQLS